MSMKFSAFYRCMLQAASCGCPRRCRIMDRHVDLLSTVCRVGGCKLSSLSRDTRYLAKDFSSELQACFGVDIRSDVASVHPPFAGAVVCHRLLVRYRAAINGRTCLCVEVVALLSSSSLTLKPAPSFPQSWRKVTEEKIKKKQTPSAAVPLPHALSAAGSFTGHISSAVATEQLQMK